MLSTLFETKTSVYQFSASLPVTGIILTNSGDFFSAGSRELFRQAVLLPTGGASPPVPGHRDLPRWRGVRRMRRLAFSAQAHVRAADGSSP